MAIVKAPALSIDASGNLGAINYTRWKGMNIARSTYVPSYTPSQKQLDQRASLTLISSKWGGALTSAERLQWEKGAIEQVVTNRLGGVYRPSGYQYFMKVNLFADFFGGGIQFIPPTKQTSVYVDETRVFMAGTTNRVHVRMTKAPGQKVLADGFEIFRAGPYASGGRKPIKPEYRFLALETESHVYNDEDIIDESWYWYKLRWFFEVGLVGNWWEGHVLTDFPV